MILFTADWHIKLGQNNVPVEWAVKRYNEFFDQVHKQASTCDMHIIGGDLFDRIPTIEELALYFSFVRNVKKPTLIFDGNHEATRKNRALTEEQMELIADLKSMDEVMPRPTPDAQKELLDRIRDNGSNEIDETLEDEFNVA